MSSASGASLPDPGSSAPGPRWGLQTPRLPTHGKNPAGARHKNLSYRRDSARRRSIRRSM